MNINKLASACINAINSGLIGTTATFNIPIAQLEDEIEETRRALIEARYFQNKLPLDDLYYSLNCIEIDCKSLDKCCSLNDTGEQTYYTSMSHFEIPQLFTILGDQAVKYIGTINKEQQFKVYTSPAFKYHKYKRRGKEKPFVYIDCTPNENNMFDCYLFNAPLLERISITAIFKDIRQIKEAMCCNMINSENLTSFESLVKDTVIAKYVKYFRQIQQPLPNNQVPR